MRNTEVRPNDLLLNITGGSLGRCAVVPSNFKIGNVSQHVCIMRPVLILPQYLHAFCLSFFFTQTMVVSGSGREGLPKYSLENMLLPLPPQTEQQRIIIEIERWFKLIDDLESNKEDLKDYIKQVKSKVLSLAISGKLVPQDPNDEPAIELLKRINPNFKPCDTSHYENLPQGWHVVPMHTLCSLSEGEQQSGGARIYLDVKYLRGRSEPKILSEGKYIPSNSSMILVDGENSGEIFTTNIEGYQGSTFKLLKITNEMYKPFILYVIKSYQKLFRENKVGSAIPHLNKKLFKEIDVLVPPLSEQKRIVKDIDDMFNIVDNISAEL